MLNIFEAISISFFTLPVGLLCRYVGESEAAEHFALCLRRAPVGRLGRGGGGGIGRFKGTNNSIYQKNCIFLLTFFFFSLLKV